MSCLVARITCGAGWILPGCMESQLPGQAGTVRRAVGMESRSSVWPTSSPRGLKRKPCRCGASLFSGNDDCVLPCLSWSLCSGQRLDWVRTDFHKLQPASSHITTMMFAACLAMAVKGDRSAVQAIPTARRDERILFDMTRSFCWRRRHKGMSADVVQAGNSCLRIQMELSGGARVGVGGVRCLSALRR